MRHLGPRVSALVDGQLSPRATERALAHAVGCPRCRDALDAERRARRVVSAAGDFEPSEDFTTRLIGLPGAAPPGLLDMSGPPPMPRQHRSRRGARVALAATAGAAAAVGGLYLLGGAAAPTVTEAEVRAAARDAMPTGAAMLGSTGLPAEPAAGEDDGAGEGGVVEEVARTAAQGDGTAAAVEWLRENGWSSPEMVPAGLEIVAVREVDDGVLEVELAGDASHVVVVERRGVLGPEELAGARPIQIGDVQAHVISQDPWTAVMQSGDDVVVVTCAGADAAGRSVLGAMPAEPAAAPGGVAERVARGWERAVSTVSSVVAGVTGRTEDARPGG